MGEMPILETWSESNEAWKAATKKPDFFVVDDMWDERSRWVRVEASPKLVNTALLLELVRLLKDFRDWCVYLALVQGGLTVFANRIFYEGQLFAEARSVNDLGADVKR